MANFSVFKMKQSSLGITSRSDFFTSSDDRNLFLIVMMALLYQVVLCLTNTLFFRISPSLVMLVEFIIYASAFICVSSIVPRYVGLILLLTTVNVSLLFLLRGFIDLKSARDLIIILLFFWLGFSCSTPNLVDKILTCILIIAIGLGLFEWLALDIYVRFFHTYSYFLNQSGIGASGGTIFENQALTLNGFRPDGIGRTILPWVFGSHRISSISLEPVSLGNFAVIVLIWAICRESLRDRQTLFYLFSVIFLISLADSRFGLAMSGILLFIRLIWPLRAYGCLAFAPWVMMIGLCVYSNFFFDGTYSDSFIGRLTHTGRVLSHLNISDILGMQTPFKFYGDIGYAYILTRFGLFYLLFSWLMFWRIPLYSPQAIRVRGLATLYIAMILSISGTSLFALKSAGFLWFILGVVSAEIKRHSLSHSRRLQGVN